MAEVKWIKLDTRLFDDYKIRLIRGTYKEKADQVILVWINLLCLSGLLNKDGYFVSAKEPMTLDQFAVMMNRNEEELRFCFDVLIEYEMIEKTRKGYHIINWNKHQNCKSLENIRNANAERQKKFRDKKREENMQNCENKSCCESKAEVDSNVTNNVTDNVTVTLRNAGEEEEERRKKNKNISSNEDIYTAFADGDTDLLNALIEFNLMRNSIKEPMTEAAAKNLCSKLKKDFPKDQWIETLKQSVLHNWKSVYPIKEESRERKQEGGFDTGKYKDMLKGRGKVKNG